MTGTVIMALDDVVYLRISKRYLEALDRIAAGMLEKPEHQREVKRPNRPNLMRLAIFEFAQRRGIDLTAEEAEEET